MPEAAGSRSACKRRYRLGIIEATAARRRRARRRRRILQQRTAFMARVIRRVPPHGAAFLLAAGTSYYVSSGRRRCRRHCRRLRAPRRYYIGPPWSPPNEAPCNITRGCRSAQASRQAWARRRLLRCSAAARAPRRRQRVDYGAIGTALMPTRHARRERRQSRRTPTPLSLRLSPPLDARPRGQARATFAAGMPMPDVTFPPAPRT